MDHGQEELPVAPSVRENSQGQKISDGRRQDRWRRQDKARRGGKGAGGAIGSEQIEGEGVFNQLVGNVQHGYGKAKDAVSDIIEDVPATVGQVVDRSRDLVQDADAAVRRKLGDNGPLYVLAGAVGFLGLALFAVARANKPETPARKTKASAARPRAAAAKTD